MLGVDFRGQGYKFAAWFPVHKCLPTHFLVGSLEKDIYLPSLGFLTWRAGGWDGGRASAQAVAGGLNELDREGPVVHCPADVGTSKCCLTELCIPQLHACSSHADLYTDVTVMLKANASTVARVRQS